MVDVFKKLNLRDQSEIVVLNAPDSFEPALSDLAGVSVVRDLGRVAEVSFSLAFVTRQEEVDRLAAEIAAKAQGDPVVWFAYPKASSRKYNCDFNRDTGWDALGNAGFEPVRQVAIDEDWSALRFRRVEHIKTFTRNRKNAISSEGKQRSTQEKS